MTASSSMSTVIQMDPDACRALAAYGRRQLGWRADLAARVMTRGSAIALFTAPPMGVLAMFAVPGHLDPADAPGVDQTLALASVVAILDHAATQGLAVDVRALSSGTVLGAPELGDLPPADGWQMPIHAISGDLTAKVDQAVSEFTARTTGLPAATQQAIAEEIWDRQSWAALPMRMLHAARRLGMLANDASRVTAANCGPWKRLSTQRGQVFIRTDRLGRRVSLSVVR